MTSWTWRRLGHLSLEAAVLMALALPVCAQVVQPATPPVGSPAVFGGARRHQPGTDSLSLTTSVLGGFDTNILAESAGVGGDLGSTEQTSSSFAGGTAQLLWRQSRTRRSVFATGGVQYRKFFDIDRFDIRSYNAATGAAFQLTPRSSLTMAGNVSLEPFYQFGVFGVTPDTPADVGPEGYSPDLLAARDDSLRAGGGVSYGYRFSPRTHFQMDVRREAFRPLTDNELPTFVSLGRTSASARIVRQLSPNLGARVGYGYTAFDRVADPGRLEAPEGEAETPVASRPRRFGVHHVDVGLDYARALAIDRRTMFSFGTGSNITQRADPNALGDSQRTHFDVTGFATLKRDFLRTWYTSLHYQRGTSYWEGYSSFGVYDRVNLSLVGLFTNRLDFSASANYSTGVLNISSGERVGSLGAGTQLRFAFSPSVAAFASYTYARFEVRDEFRLNLPDNYRPERQGVRVGLTVWLDLLR